MENNQKQKVYMVFIQKFSYMDGHEQELVAAFSSFEKAKEYVLKQHEFYSDLKIDRKGRRGVWFQDDEENIWRYGVNSIELDCDDDIRMECNIPLED